jgi:hypothetical protein
MFNQMEKNGQEAKHQRLSIKGRYLI